jgi:hypothetical protein
MNEPEVKAAQATADTKLDAATIAQLSFKAGTCKDIAVTIVVAMLDDRIQWQDEIDLSFVEPADKNCIGMTWRRLIKLGMLERLSLNRRSTQKAAKGRTVWKYHLKSSALAQRFLSANGRAIRDKKQPELFKEPINP